MKNFLSFIQGVMLLLFTIAFFVMMVADDIPFYTAKGKEFKIIFTALERWTVTSVLILNTVALFKNEIRFLLQKTPIGKIISKRFGGSSDADVKK